MISEQTIDSYAAFADLTWHASERLDINPGIRFDYETVDAHAQGGVSLDDSDSFSAVSPKLGATYALTDDWRAYGLFSTGFKAGGFTRTLTPANIAFTYEPQQTYNGEVGIKYRAPDGWLEGSLAAYYNVTTDYQMFVGVQPVQYLQNVGEVTAKGVDLSVTARPTDRLEVSAAVGYNHTTFTDYSNPVTPGVDRTGNTVPYAPELTGNLSLAYTFDLADGWGQLTPRLGMTYASEIFFDETNTIGQGDVTLVDLGVKWRVNDKVVADAFVNNVFDETYAVYGFQFPQYGNLYQLGSGRAYGGRISFAF